MKGKHCFSRPDSIALQEKKNSPDLCSIQKIFPLHKHDFYLDIQSAEYSAIRDIDLFVTGRKVFYEYLYETALCASNTSFT